MSSDGSILAIGNFDGSGDGATYIFRQGEVNVYSWNGNSWTQLGQEILGGSSQAQLGYSVSLSADGTRLAVGAAGNSLGASFANVYEYNGNNWVKIGDFSTTQNGNDFGETISLSADGSTVVVGAQRHDSQYYWNGRSSTARDIGIVQVFEELQNGNWAKKGSDIRGVDVNNYIGRFGRTVSSSSDGSKIAIGYGGAQQCQGCGVNVYHWYNNSWIKLGGNIQADSNVVNFGASVSLSSDGNRIAVGAVMPSYGGNNSPGDVAYL